jgi:hypothetical protein
MRHTDALWVIRPDQLNGGFVLTFLWTAFSGRKHLMRNFDCTAEAAATACYKHACQDVQVLR